MIMAVCSEERAHSKIGPSKSHEWMHCPGSVSASEGCPDSSGEAADLGTAGHLLGELTINKNIRSPELWKRPDIIKGKNKEFSVDKDMSAAVGVYTSYVYETRLIRNNPEVQTEIRLHLPEIHDELFGTNDCCIAEPFGLLETIDYKHGSGNIVEIVNGEITEEGIIIDSQLFEVAEETVGTSGIIHSVVYYPPVTSVNTQLLIYALGAMKTLWDVYKDVKLTIVQPRCDHEHGKIRSVVLKPQVILDWAVAVLKPAAEKCFSDNPEFNIGPWCKWCKAKCKPCPAVFKEAIVMTGNEETALVAKQPQELVFKDPKEMNPVELGKALEFAKLFKSWGDDIAEYIKEQLRTGQMTSATLGFKRVEGNKSRSWKENYESEVVQNSNGMLQESELYNAPTAKSPAQLENLLKDKGVTKKARDKILKEAIIETPGNPKLVPISNSKAELPPDAENVFIDHISK